MRSVFRADWQRPGQTRYSIRLRKRPRNRAMTIDLNQTTADWGALILLMGNRGHYPKGTEPRINVMTTSRGTAMRTPQSFIAYVPYGVGIMCALVYIEKADDVYGWWIGARDAEYLSSYFKLENFFTTRPTRFYATDSMDRYGGWKFLYSARKPLLDKPVPIDDEVAHELDRLQDMFVAEWL